jgi:hypothetical protein
MDQPSTSISKKTFYFLLSASTVAMASGLYLIYKTLFEKKNDEDGDILIENYENQKVWESAVNEKLNEKVNENVNENVNDKVIQETITDINNKLSPEQALSIHAEISKIFLETSEHFDSEEELTKRKNALNKLHNPDNIDNPDKTWYRTVNQMIREKIKNFNETKKQILNKYNISLIEFDDIVSKSLSHLLIERELFKIYKPKFENDLPPSNLVKEAFIWHCNKILELYKNLISTDMSENDKRNFMDLESARFDDELFFQFGYTIHQIKYLLNFYNLYEDKYVFQMYESIY